MAISKRKIPTIILIESDKISLELCKKKLTAIKSKILTATQGKEGLKLILKHKPDLIMTDLVIPKIDGFELLRKLKINEKTNNIPVIVFSNINNKNDEKEALRLGAANYLIKSKCPPAQLANKIKKVLKK